MLYGDSGLDLGFSNKTSNDLFALSLSKKILNLTSDIIYNRGARPFYGEGQHEKWSIDWGPRVYLLKKFGQSRSTPCLHPKDLRTDTDSTHFKFIYISKINSN